MEPIDALYAALGAPIGIICRSPTPDLFYGKLMHLRKKHVEFQSLSFIQRGELIYIRKMSDASET